VDLHVTESPLAIRRLDGAVAVLVLNRPDALNALDTELARALITAAADVAADRSVRAVVLTGAGTRAFCAGADLKERRGMTGEQWRAQHDVFEGAFHALRDLGKPVFAAVNGVALGGGCELALNTDFIIAAEGARFGQPEVRLGIIPGGGGTQHLPRRVGPGMARQLLMTGEIIDAATALRAGLVNSVHPADALLDEAVRIARAIAANSPAAVREVRLAVRDGEALGIAEAMEAELVHYGRLVDHPDRHEGIEAFNAKRAPRFEDPA
jgi:enoyl-CoA hydratase/carnithine racemase